MNKLLRNRLSHRFQLVKKPQITQISIGKKTTNLHELTLIQLDKMLTLARL